MSIATIILLFIMGIFGVLSQALKKMSELNKRFNGDFTFGQYLRIERFSLLGSVIFVSASTLFIYMVPDMAKKGMWLVGGQFMAGWFGQSGLEFLVGEAADHIASKLGASKDEVDKLKT